MKDQNRNSQRKLGFIHNVSPTRKFDKGNLYYDLLLPVGENESTKIIGYNQEMYDKVKKLSEKHSPVNRNKSFRKT